MFWTWLKAGFHWGLRSVWETILLSIRLPFDWNDSFVRYWTVLLSGDHYRDDSDDATGTPWHCHPSSVPKPAMSMLTIWQTPMSVRDIVKMLVMFGVNYLIKESLSVAICIDYDKKSLKTILVIILLGMTLTIWEKVDYSLLQFCQHHWPEVGYPEATCIWSDS